VPDDKAARNAATLFFQTLVQQKPLDCAVLCKQMSNLPEGITLSGVDRAGPLPRLPWYASECIRRLLPVMHFMHEYFVARGGVMEIG